MFSCTSTSVLLTIAYVPLLACPSFGNFCRFFCVCVCLLFYLQIGVILRDSNGIAQVRAITGSKILRVLKANGKHALGTS